MDVTPEARALELSGEGEQFAVVVTTPDALELMAPERSAATSSVADSS